MTCRQRLPTIMACSSHHLLNLSEAVLGILRWIYKGQQRTWKRTAGRAKYRKGRQNRTPPPTCRALPHSRGTEAVLTPGRTQFLRPLSSPQTTQTAGGHLTRDPGSELPGQAASEWIPEPQKQMLIAHLSQYTLGRCHAALTNMSNKS